MTNTIYDQVAPQLDTFSAFIAYYVSMITLDYEPYEGSLKITIERECLIVWMDVESRIHFLPKGTTVGY